MSVEVSSAYFEDIFSFGLFIYHKSFNYMQQERISCNLGSTEFRIFLYHLFLVEVIAQEVDIIWTLSFDDDIVSIL